VLVNADVAGLSQAQQVHLPIVYSPWATFLKIYVTTLIPSTCGLYWCTNFSMISTLYSMHNHIYMNTTFCWFFLFC